MKKVIYISLIISIFFLNLIAQEQRRPQMGPPNISGKVTGMLIDEQSGKPIEYGNVVLYRFRDSSMVNGTISNSKGIFTLENVNVGRYFIKISFIGYDPKIIDSVLVTPRNPEVDLGTIKLLPAIFRLGDVVVQGEKELIINNLDKKVINVEKDLGSVGGTALDVMQNLPSVTVDADGNVALRGNTNIRLLIDGKPSNMEGLSNYDILTQIPASQIEQVELVTNPSVRYDPEGTAGIINIVLKKKKDPGINGIVSLNIGTNDKYNSSFNFNYRLDGINLYAGYDGRVNRFKSSGTNNRVTTASSIPFLYQDQTGLNKWNSHNFTLGADYALNEFNSFSSSIKYRRNSGGSSFKNLDLTSNNSIQTVSEIFRTSSGVRNFENLSFILNYKRSSEQKGREFTTDFLYSNFHMTRQDDADQLNKIYFPSSVVNQTARRIVGDAKNYMYILQTNYTHPFKNGIRLETGFQSTIRSVKSTSDYFNFDFANNVFVENTTRKNYFNYDEQIYAAYGIFAHSVFGVKYQVGFRGEKVLTNSTLPLEDKSFRKDYTSLYPSVHVSYQLFPMNEIQFSYSRRVDRPNNRQLNPMVDYQDSLNLFAGNPFLNPQYTNSYEINLNNAIGFTFLNTSFFYRSTDGIISQVTELLPNGSLYMTFGNIAKSESYGVDFVLTQPLSRWWRIMANFSWVNIKLDGKGILNIDQEASSWNTRFMSSFTFWDKTQLQLIFSYVSPSITIPGFFGGFGGGGGRGGNYGNQVLAQGKTYEMYGVDLAMRKDFLNDQLSVSLRLTDLFNTRKFGGELIGDGFNAKFSRKMESRTLFLGISYKFNNYKQKRERFNTDEIEQEMF